MGSRGPVGRNQDALKARGSKHALNAGKGLPVGYEPPMPESFRGKGKTVIETKIKKRLREAWKMLVPVAAAEVPLSRVDVPALARLCQLTVILEDAWAEMQDGTGYLDVIPVGNGETSVLKDRTCVERFRKMNREILELQNQFGLTPAARSRLKVAPPSAPKDNGKASVHGLRAIMGGKSDRGEDKKP